MTNLPETAPGDREGRISADIASGSPARRVDPPPAWTRWIVGVSAVACCAGAAALYVLAARAAGVSLTTWAPAFEAVARDRTFGALLLTAATLFSLAGLLGTIGVVVGPRPNRVWGMVALAISAAVLVMGALAWAAR